mmetsp:Transcript_106922/g.312641  ORF Transcript_106922/g.312641 Transcript_106922/m.312641 type:complete len:488 (+) Transcript_106922:87-1550(+)
MARAVPNLAGTLKGGTAGTTKGPMSLGDPFAAFLAVRQVPGQQLEATRLQPMWRTKKAAGSSDSGRDTASDPFASFMALRPPRPSPPPESLTEQSLREDLLRTKRQLLEVGLKAELKALDPACPPETATRLRRVRKAQWYLQHPERTLEAMSGPASEASDDEPEAHLPHAPGRCSSKHLTPRRSAEEAGLSDSPSLTAHKQGTALQRGSSKTQVLLASASAPSLRSDAPSPLLTVAQDGGAAKTLNLTSLPPIVNGATEMTPLSTKHEVVEDKSPLLQFWWTRTKSWNVGFSHKELTAQRHNLSMSGGTVVLGNGRLPLFTGSHLLSAGFFYSFQVGSLDDRHFPLEGCRDLSCGFGVSRFPPQHRNCERPVFAYEIPDSVLVGYGDHLIDRGKWWHTDWNPRELREGDMVGVLIPPDGDFVVFVNGDQVLRARTSLGEEGDFSKARSAQRRTLYPVVDLHGRICSVTLLPRQSPPNKILQPRNRLR